jgi:hypothetical protein
VVTVIKFPNQWGVLRICAIAVLWLVCVAAAPVVKAATFDEIVSMTESGLSPEVIIEVIEATGLDKPIDVDTWLSLEEQGVDKAVLEYLATLLPTDTSDEASGGEYATGGEYDSNRIGGEGFHHNQYPNYPPQNSNNSDYWDGPHYRDYYPPLGSIGVYVPPVYVPYNYPNYPYYNAYPPANPYYYNRGYWDNGWYVLYDENNYIPYNPYYDGYGSYGWNNSYWTGNAGDWYRRWRHDHDRDNFGGSIRYEGDNFGISLHF